VGQVVEDRASADRRAGSMYGAPVRTRRVFVAVTLEPEARAAVAEVAAGLRRDFPLDARLLEGAVRWVDPEAYHVTLDALDVEPLRVAALVAAVGRAVEASRQGPFVVRTGALGSFWRSAGSGWGRVPRVVWLGLDGAGAGPLLRLREAVDAACGGLASGSGQGFCAHITLGKTRARGGDGLAVAERRALRALGKWVQDPGRPLALQQLLAGAAAGGGADGGGGGGGGRGGKRARSWLRQVDVGTLSGRQKQAMTKQLRKSGRDLGALNAQLASDFAGDGPAGPADIAPGVGGEAVEAKVAGVEIAVEAVSVIEAVPVAGTGRVRYTVLERFELGRGPG
jgi:2'-5' RNA ligase